MMKLVVKFLFFLLFSFAFCVFSQDEIPVQKTVIDGKTFILHPVKAGETLYSIGNRYNVDMVLILNSNPQLISGLKAGDVLRIPAAEQKQLTVSEETSNMPDRLLSHDVKRRETLFSISRQYGITIDDILNYNPGLGQLRRGETIRIPQWDEKKDQIPALVEDITDISVAGKTHMVVPGETFFSIARRYGIPVQELIDANQGVDILKPGMSLNLPVVMVEEKIEWQLPQVPAEHFVQHTIVSGETLFSLTRKYDVSAERLVELNPVLNGSFRAGTVINIPVVARPDKDEIYLRHIVKKDETLSDISKNYRVASEDIIRWNRFLEYRNVLLGDTINIIPGVFDEKAGEATDEYIYTDTGDCERVRLPLGQRRTVNIAMLLPLMVERNLNLNQHAFNNFNQYDSYSELSDDTVQIVDPDFKPKIQFHGNSENFIHFYEGALIAVDTLRKLGISVNLNIIDTESNQLGLQHIISAGKLHDADLIIGPVFANQQREIADFAAANRIPIISPLSVSTEFTQNNPWYFQINPTREIIDIQTAQYVAGNYLDGNFIVVRTGNQANVEDNEIVRLIQQEALAKNRRINFRLIDVQKVGFEGLRKTMDADRKNIIILNSGNEVEVSVGLSNLHTLARDFDITVIGSNRFIQFESINHEYFHDGKLEFLAPYWPDYSKEGTQRFVQQFRNNFRTEPNQFSMQGYDVTLFFSKAVHEYGRDFRRCITTINPSLVQGNYRFEALPNGGFINHGLNLVRYTRDYRVISQGL